MSPPHSWTVHHIILRSPHGGLARYRPACDCGWSGVLHKSEADAAKVAYHHATGQKVKARAVKHRTKPSDDQTEPLFDVRPYEKGNR